MSDEDVFLKEVAAAWSVQGEKARFAPPQPGGYPCPCCALPGALHERGVYDICPRCGWEDDGQDDPYADESWGFSPNGGLSLTDARARFAQYGDVFLPDDPRHPWAEQTGWTANERG